MPACASVHGLRSTLTLGILLLCAAAAPVGAQDVSKTPPPTGSQTNPQGEPAQGQGSPPYAGRFLVGDSAPDVDLKDQNGVRFHLSEARRAKPWLLIFAPNPKDAVTAEGALPGIEELNVGLVVIAPYPRERLTRLYPKAQVRFLSDRPNRAARNYGLFDAQTTNSRAGAFLIDSRGRILLIMSGGIPSNIELVRLTREALEAAGQRPPQPPENLSND